MDASSGASGDMLLGALVGAGVPLEVLSAAVTAVAPEAVGLRTETVVRGALAATRCHVDVADSHTHRTWRDVAALLAAAPLADEVRDSAHATFERLAVAEAAVHGTTPEEVHFHEVGALDAIADVVGVCAGLHHLGLSALVVSPVAVGSGRVRGAHGDLPVPPPAVVELLRGAPSYAGPAGAPQMELCTPTGAALLVSHATSFGAQPMMAVATVGVGAGGRDPEGHANVVRLLVGEPVGSVPAAAGPGGSGGAVVLETNVDDLDPRLWPDVIAALLEAGASDAWLTPILMKKGRPAHTLHVLAAPDRVDAARAAVFRQTSTIGVREVPVGKTALDRETRTVAVAGHQITVKLALLDGRVVNAQPEYVDVAHVAARTHRPIKDVLAEAVAATQELL
ncbi:nickel pincer cofactor biosynthesis protein LarC [Nocardioides mesophilus]|uniref:nickel pincer cofactor biosynthesis protein LarC n=1 Tax=Nocardioides mesophilus TaxID=433659 RepID=UPI001FECF4F0|nr:nickel pincer cofactor biosynthesis protein LarC [Nocardioides mesophilus]